MLTDTAGAWTANKLIGDTFSQNGGESFPWFGSTGRFGGLWETGRGKPGTAKSGLPGPWPEKSENEHALVGNRTDRCGYHRCFGRAWCKPR